MNPITSRKGSFRNLANTLARMLGGAGFLLCMIGGSLIVPAQNSLSPDGRIRSEGPTRQDYSTNLWLEITNGSNHSLNGWIHNSTPTIPYTLQQKQNLLDAVWTPAVTFYGAAATTNTPFFNVPLLGRDTLFLRARSQLASRTILSESRNTVALKRDGTVWAWGINDDGELGNGQGVGSPVPVQVIGLSNIVAIAGPEAGMHTLALDSSGTLWGWGAGGSGQLGRGDGSYNDEIIPRPVPGLSNIVAIAAGWAHSVALKSDGTVWAWGYNRLGELGDGTQTTRDYPAPVLGLTNVIDIISGSDHNFALCADGTIWAWGYNGDGELGIGSQDNQLQPAQIPGLTGVVALAGGDNHSLALLADGSVMVWGEGRNGELSPGAFTNALIPVAVAGLSNIVAVASGGYHNLAIDTYGLLYEWGDGGSDQMGNGIENWRQVLFPFTAVSNVVGISAGEYNSAVLTGDGRIYQWGVYGYLYQSDWRQQVLPFMYNLYDSVDTTGGGLPDWFKVQVGMDTNSVDSFNSGILDYLTVYLGLDPANPPPLQLGFWKFDTTNWLGEIGQVPLTSSNLQSVPDWSGNALHIGTNAPASLSYHEVETNISPVLHIGQNLYYDYNLTATQANYSVNILLRQGTIRFWFRPDWSSVSLGGSGPGANAALIAVGSHAAGFTADYWGLEFSPDGNTLRFSSEGGGLQYVYCDAAVAFSSNQWCQITLTYNTSTSVIYTNGQQAATGTGVAEYPNAAARQALGFNVGSTADSSDQAFGQFDNLETFNYAMSATDVGVNFYQALASGTFQPPSLFVNSNSFNVVFQGVPVVAVAVLVNDTNNYSDAVTQTYYADPNTGLVDVPVTLSPNDGVNIVAIGIWNGSSYQWITRKVVLDTTPPTIVPAGYSATTNSPLLQLTGYANETLSSITFDVVNNQATNLNQTGFVVASDGNTFAGVPSTNWFQCFDIVLAPGPNTITLRCADLAGNVATNIYSYTLDTSTMTAPTLSVDWPSDGTMVSGSKITVKGHVSDPTAMVTAQVQQNGSTNDFPGVVERDGTFWIDNVSLPANSNSISVLVTNVAGQAAASVLTVQTAPVNITVDPISGDALKGDTATVNGTIDSGGYSVTVNGVSANVWTNDDGSIHWQAFNVPVNDGGVAVFRVQAVSGSDPETLATFNKPTFIRVSRYTETLNYHYISGQSLTYPWSIFYDEISLQRSREWANGAGGNGSSEFYMYHLGLNEGPGTTLIGPCQTTWMWPPEEWPNTTNSGVSQSCSTFEFNGLGFDPLWFYAYWLPQESASDIPWEHVDTQLAVPPYEFFLNNNPLQPQESPQYDFSKQSQTRLELVVGGRALPGQPTQVTLRATASAMSNPSGWVLRFEDGSPVGAEPFPQGAGDVTVQPANIQIAGMACVDSGDGTNGLLTLAVPPGTANLDVTPMVSTSSDGYSFDVKVLTPLLVADNNRDGQLEFDGSDGSSPSKPFRMWINDAQENGDVSSADNDIPGSGTPNYALNQVNGRSDLINFFPVAMQLTEVLQQWPPMNGYEYHLAQADSAVKFVYTSLLPGNAFDYLTAATATNGYGVNGNEPPQSADTIQVLPSAPTSGAKLDAGWLTQVQTNGGVGVILLEGAWMSAQPLVLEIWHNGNKVQETELYLSIAGVEQMYRWINLRDSFAVSGETQPTINYPSRTDQPSNFPDNASDGRQVIYVHGYNVSESRSRAEISQAFKRLWQSRSKAMFTGVSWYGDQAYSQLLGTSLDYYSNVRNAFLTAPNLASAVASLPGTHKLVIAHSLGNMVVSSAIVDWDMSVEKYFAIDAAVAMEAYDGSIRDLGMVNPNAGGGVTFQGWPSYDQRLWSTEWYQLFDPSDGRSGLTWRDRFGVIPILYNFYSSGEEVLENPPGYQQLPSLGAEWIWVTQEMRKGTGLFDLLGSLWLVDSHPEAGWAINTDWYVLSDPSHPGSQRIARYPYQATTNDISDDALRADPFCRVFNDSTLNGTGGSAEATNIQVRAEMLGVGLPALSHAAGANSVSVFVDSGGDRNVPLMSFETGWPAERVSGPYGTRWLHSDLKNVAYPFNHELHDTIVQLGGLDQ